MTAVQRWTRGGIWVLVVVALLGAGCEEREHGGRAGFPGDDDQADDDVDDDAGDDTGDDTDDDTDDDADDDADDDTGGDLAWSELTTGGQSPGALAFVEALADQAGARMLFYGGARNPWPTALSEMVVLDFLTDAFGRIEGTGDLPPALYGAAAGIDEAAGRFYLFGGASDPLQPSAGLYVLDLAAGVWTLAGDGTDSIGPRLLASAFFDGDRLLVFGGADDTARTELFGDLWQITWNGNPGEAQFAPLSATGPAPRSNAATCKEDATGLWYLFGGAGDLAGFDDLWRLDPTSETWAEIATQGQAPPAVHSARCFVDSARGRLIAFGGYDDQGNEHAEVWVLDLSATPPTWTTIPAAGQAISPRYAGAMAYDAAGDRLVYYGGLRFDETPVPYRVFFQDAYEMLLGTPERR